MKEEIYRWGFVEREEDTDETSVESSTEEFKSIYELWDELLFLIFNPNINLFRKYFVNSNLEILIWKNNDKAIKLTLFIDLENYFIKSEELAACLAITIKDIKLTLFLDLENYFIKSDELAACLGITIKDIKLTLFLDLENYFIKSEELAACLGITIKDIKEVELFTSY